MKVAYLIMGECRFPKTSVQKINKYIVEFYGADLYICCQKVSGIDEEIVNQAFTKNVQYRSVYDKPDPCLFFENPRLMEYPTDNCFNEPYLQYYINLYKMSEIISDKVGQYDYFMCMRPDMDILFPFPEPEVLESIPIGVYSIDAAYARHWGGLSIGIFVHKSHIIDYLRCYNDVIKNRLFDSFLENHIIKNQEHFFLYCLKQKQIGFKYINNLNYFFTADNLSDRTTWSYIQFDESRQKYFKYKDQYEEAFQNLGLWENGFRWGVRGQNISLVCPPAPPIRDEESGTILPIPSRIKYLIQTDPETGVKKVMKNKNFIHPGLKRR